MFDTLWLVLNVFAQLCLALLVIYVTCLILRGFINQDHAEGEKHHE
ncbi:hypothetical protein PLCT2_02535 [Planctomycetaceae bacterium]|nr:hypothetical protein PLCT2_02535 [Planctomycetaceae bacterium]